MKNAVKNLVKEVDSFLDFFDRYVESVRDTKGFELFEETGGSDYSLDDMRHALVRVKTKLEPKKGK